MKRQGHRRTSKTFYHFAYLNDPKGDRELRPFQVRDGAAAFELSEPLYDRGYRNGGVLLNFPCPSNGKPIEIPYAHLGSSDLLLLTTRAPLDDAIALQMKRIRRSRNQLEGIVFACLRKYFCRCTRAQITLSEDLVQRASAEIAARQNMQFTQRKTARCEKYSGFRGDAWQKLSPDVQLTAAFLIHSRELWPGGPSLLAAFGIGGTETLGWAHLLKTKYHHLICTEEFVMAEIAVPHTETENEPFPSDLSFADRWNVSVFGASRPRRAQGASAELSEQRLSVPPLLQEI